jgi:large subunit ribosomal protein L29
MAILTAAELRNLGKDELLEKLANAKEELFNLRFQLATGQLDNPSRMRVVRHEVARIATVLREREIEEGLGVVGPGPEDVPADGPEDVPEDLIEDGEDQS